jgi:hypothetical protein
MLLLLLLLIFSIFSCNFAVDYVVLGSTAVETTDGESSREEIDANCAQRNDANVNFCF